MDNDTLLVQFIRGRLERYIEPERRRTARGHPIGLSRVKFTASLLLLTRASRKQIASSLGISYAVLGNWCSEERFKEQVKKHRRDFYAMFKEEVIKTAKQSIESYEEYVRSTAIHGIEDKEVFHYDFFLPVDYSTTLWVATTMILEDMIQQKIRSQEDFSIKAFAIGLYGYMQSWGMVIERRAPGAKKATDVMYANERELLGMALLSMAENVLRNNENSKHALIAVLKLKHLLGKPGKRLR